MPDVWYSGLRVTRARPLTSDDAIALHRLRRVRWRSVAVGLASPLLIAAFGFLAYVVFDAADILRLASTAATAIALTARPWRIIPALRRRLAALARDEAAGEVLVCEGLGGELIFAMDEERRLQPAVLVRGPKDERMTVEVLPHSGAILSVNGTPMRGWNEMQRGTTAPPSAHALAAANFVHGIAGNGELAIGERVLAPEELEELLAHAPMLSPLDLSLAVAVGSVAVVSWWHAIATSAPTLSLPILSSIAAIWSIVRAHRRWRLHRRFAPDLAHGRVVIVRQQENGAATGIPFEYLPFSGWLWSANHQPAPWRRLPLARGTYVRRGPT
jgi:hypothetical protein